MSSRHEAGNGFSIPSIAFMLRAVRAAQVFQIFGYSVGTSFIALVFQIVIVSALVGGAYCFCLCRCWPGVRLSRLAPVDLVPTGANCLCPLVPVAVLASVDSTVIYVKKCKSLCPGRASKPNVLQLYAWCDCIF